VATGAAHPLLKHANEGGGMPKEYVIMTIIELPFPADPLPGQAIQLRILDLACDRCSHRLDHNYIPPRRVLKRCCFHENLNVLQSRKAFIEEDSQQMELFHQGTEPAQPVA
jgi:hypothetical protein